MDPNVVIIALAQRVPWLLPLLAALFVLSLVLPAIVRAGGWEGTRWGHVIVEVGNDVRGALKAPSGPGDPKP